MLDKCPEGYRGEEYVANGNYQARAWGEAADSTAHPVRSGQQMDEEN